jgi:UDP-N-acetylglucosamine 2-epimerase
MKTGKKVIMLCAACLLFAGSVRVQWVVTDPGNLAQGIINATKNIVQTSTTARNMVSNFQETVKIYQQGKKYYDALKSVNNLVKDARKVQKTILLVGDITDIYVVNFQRMMRDENFTVDELGAIATGYTKLLEESNDVLSELKNVVNITTLSMTDKERMDVVERSYSKMKRYRNLVSYYTNKNISVSYLRARKKNDLDRIMKLYGSANERYW